MRELFYAGIQLTKDMEFCDYVDELAANPNVLIIRLPEKHIVHEMEYVNNPPRRALFAHDRRDTLRIHVGFYYHYIRFAYKGIIFCMSASDYYPFTDENFPGRFNFVAYKRVGLTQEAQCTYPIAYEGLQSVDAWMERTRCRRDDLRQVKGSSVRPITQGITPSSILGLIQTVNSSGGYREKSIMEQTPYIVVSETWNDDHKVIHIVAEHNPGNHADGHRDSFDFDLVTRTICG